MSVGAAINLLATDVTVNPTSGGIPLGGFVQKCLDWLGQYGLWVAVIGIIGGIAVSTFGHFTGNPRASERGRQAAFAGLALAAVIGGGPAFVNLLFKAASKA